MYVCFVSLMYLYFLFFFVFAGKTPWPQAPTPMTTSSSRPKPRGGKKPKKTPNVQRKPEVKRKPTRKRPAKQLDIGGIFGDTDLDFDLGDFDSDDGELDVDNLFMGDVGDDDGACGSDCDAANSDDDLHSTPPLVDVVRLLVKQMPLNVLPRLLETWRMLAKLSERAPVKIGSGCSGSGLDWHAMNAINEVCM